MDKLDDTFKQITKTSPPWAVGITSIIVSFTLCLGAIYVTGRPEVQEYMHHSFEVDTLTRVEDQSVLRTVLNLVTVNAAHIAELSKTLNMSQDQNIKLSERLQKVEHDILAAKASLDACEAKLRLLRK